MDENKISVISLENQYATEHQGEDSEGKEEIQDHKEKSAWNMCHVFSVLIICFVFLVPLNFIPRTNSIFYPSKWYEFNFVMMGSILLLVAASDILKMATFFKEKSFMSFRMMLRMYSFVYCDMDCPIPDCLLDLVSILEVQLANPIPWI